MARTKPSTRIGLLPDRVASPAGRLSFARLPGLLHKVASATPQRCVAIRQRRRYPALPMARRSIGIVYELLDAYPRRPDDPPDAHVEYEPEVTLLALEAAIERLGHRAVRLGRPHDLLDAAAKRDVAIDAALCIAEGFGTRNREAWAPVLLEMLGVPQLGSDALSLSLSLDKAWTRAVVAAAGVPVAPGVVVRSREEAERVAPPGGFPCFVKPRWEGTAKGIERASRVASQDALVAAVARVVSRYRQPALVEHFLEGAEYTVTVIGNDPPRALPVLQRALEVESRIGLHAVETRATSLPHVVPGSLDAPLEAQLASLAIRAYQALECRDFARADFKCDAAGAPTFLEINPLPTFAPDGSFGILAEVMNRTHEDLLAEVLALGLRRLGLC
ncbi:MAG: D-alanine--D-alanine ligase [Deltaproteobacteria bacterium]|nr:D-alanine--D-alanine ligase [Deltaproteobacteria bacterium]